MSDLHFQASSFRMRLRMLFTLRQEWKIRRYFDSINYQTWQNSIFCSNKFQFVPENYS